MLCIFRAPPGFSGAQNAAEDALFPAELGVLGRLYFDIDSESAPDIGALFCAVLTMTPWHKNRGQNLCWGCG